MSTKLIPNPLDRNTLFPHQAAFLGRFLADDSPRAHLLSGAPGTGTTFVSAAILGASLDASSNPRILLIHAMSEVVRHQAWLAAAGRSEHIRWIDYRTFREMEADSPQDKGPWSNPGIYAMSAETARKEHVRLSLFAQPWDLMILSDAKVLISEGDSQTEGTGLHLTGLDVRKILLISSHSATRSLESDIKGLAICEWKLPMTDRGGNPWPPAASSTDRSYSPSDLEKVFYERLEKFTSTTAPGGRGQFVAQQLLARSRSSPLAIESAIRKLQNALRTQDPQLVWLRSAAGLMDFDAASYWTLPFSEESSIGHNPIWKDSHAAARDLDGLLADFEKIYRDPKLATLLDLVRELGTDGTGNRQSVCIFTSFKVTASYVSSAINENMSGVLLLTGDTGFQESRAALETYNTRGGVMVATLASVAGFDLSRAEVLIHYDLPLNPEEYLCRVSRAPRARNVRLIKAVK